MSSRKEKIIEVSIELFNTKGAINTTTRHICDELGISVGNLYYYFKNKEEIIILIYQKFMDELGAHFTSIDKDVDSAFDYYKFLTSQMEFEYKYRFLRLEMANLMSSYGKVKEALSFGSKIKLEQLTNLYLHQMRFGYQKKIDHKELEFVTANSWIIGSQWEIFWLVTNDLSELERRKKGVLNLLYFLKPYLTRKGLEKTNLMDSIDFLQKENNETI